MDLLVLGSSDAFNGAGRCHSAYVIQDGAAPAIAIDFGATTLLALRRAGMAGTDLAAVVITHLHGDHFGGLPFLLLDGMYHDVRTAPLELVGAFGLEARVNMLFQALYSDVASRERPYPTRFAELLPGDVRDVFGYRIEAFHAAHMDPPELPLCLRITGPSGKVIAFSGDTEPCEGFTQASRGADLLVAECTGLRPPCGRHLSWNPDWRELISNTGASRILLSHLSREVRENIPTLLAECPPGIELFFADDLLRVVV
jgi:ribonuclease BN (tRNA processing enzyme)